MNNSSPAHITVSAAAVAGGGQAGSSSTATLASDDITLFHFPADLVSVEDPKDEALLVLKSDLMAALNKEVKSLDEDEWKFAGPRSQIHLISRPGSLGGRQSSNGHTYRAVFCKSKQLVQGMANRVIQHDCISKRASVENELRQLLLWHLNIALVTLNQGERIIDLGHRQKYPDSARIQVGLIF